MNSKRLRKGDLLLIVVLVIIGVSAIAYTMFVSPRQQKGTTVIVEIDGEVVRSFDINEDIQGVRFDTPNGYNVLEIQDGQVRISEADCPDLLCVHTGWRQLVGQSIICLPHRLIVSITGDNDVDRDIDGFTY